MNKVYLLDTNIVSEFTKDNPNQKVLALYTARKYVCDFCRNLARACIWTFKNARRKT